MLQKDEEHANTRNQLQTILDRNDVSRFVGPSDICNWLIHEDKHSSRFVHTVKILSGLFKNEFFKGTERAEELMDVLMRLSQQVNGYKGLEADNTVILSNITIPPLEWTEPYTETLDLLNDMKFPEACRKFDETFLSLLEESTTEREPYRLFFNASNAYLYGGRPDLGMACLEYSLKLNPNYPPSRERIKALRSKKMDILVNLGSGARVILGRDISEVGSVDPVSLPPFYLIMGLISVGARVSRENFNTWSERYNSVKDIINDELEIDDEDRELVTRSISALWRIYCPDVPHHELLEKVLRDLDGEIDEPEENNERIDSLLAELEGLIFNEKKNILKDFPGFYEGGSYDTEAMMAVLMYLDRNETSRKRGLKIAKELEQRTGSLIWSVAIQFLREDDIEKAEKIADEYREDDHEYVLLWQIAERFLDNRMSSSEPADQEPCEEDDLSIFDDPPDEEDLLDELIERDMFDRFKEIAEDESWREGENPEIIFHPASIYYRYLKGLGLNFQSEEDVESVTIPFISCSKDKIGRNEPCPCGSGKRYKNCCLRYDRKKG
ncbi:MAG: SEC-C metal-binding domain-containing protein [Thermoplasmatota archaeon]